MAADSASLDKKINKCWNCRRNRLKCDGTLPHCQKCAQRGAECPGYADKPLRWVSGVASRGQMMGRTYESKPSPPRASTKRTRSQLVISAYEPKKKKANLGHPMSPPTPPPTSPPTSESQSTPPPISPSLSPSTSSTTSFVALAPSKCLVEPMLQHLRYDDRYLLDYFVRQVSYLFAFSEECNNPYREVLPMIGSCQATTSAIMAVAACHAVHYMTGTTVAQLSGPLGQSSRSNSIKERRISFSNDYTCSRLLEGFWNHKQKALNLFSHDLTNLNGSPDVLTFATAVLLALVEVFESGSGSWMVHIEGAKQLLSASLHGDLSYLPTVLEGFIHEVTLFEIFGQTLPPAGSVTKSFDMPKSAECVGPQFLSNLTCPTAILHCIETVAVLFKKTRSSIQDSDSPSDSPLKSTTDAIRSQLEALHHFDAEVWAMQAKALDFRAKTLSHETLVGLHTIWQQSAAIYTSCVLYTLASEEIAVQMMVDDFISALTHLSDATLMRCLNWPTFIAGAACQKKEQREWVLATQRQIWNVTRCANSFTATSVLVKLWGRHDSLGIKEGEMWDWISELSSFGEHWNFF